MGKKVLVDMLTPKCESQDGKYMYVYHVFLFTGAGDEILAEIPSPFVSTSLLQEIQHFRDEGKTQMEIYSILRNRTVPAGYTYTSWKPGTANSVLI